MPITGTTPLLLLLDGVLSQDVERVQNSVSEMRTRLRRNASHPWFSPHCEEQELPVVAADETTSTSPWPLMALSPLLELSSVDSAPSPRSFSGSSDHDQRDGSFPIVNQDEVVANQLLQSTPLLVALIQHVLHVFPEWARICSTRDGSLPIHFAANLGSVAVADVLLNVHPEASTTPNAKGKIALHYAAREGRGTLVDYLLLKNPRTAAIASKKDKLALHFAAGEGHEEVVRSLLRVYPQGASLPSAKGKVPLHFAARWNHINIAEELLQLFPDGVRAMDWEGSLPLHDAARQGQSDMAQLLVERFPLALCVQNLRGEVPLFPAARSGSVDLVSYLVQAWPEGSRQVLQSLSKDDRIDSWNWDILELLLRGASQHLEEEDGAEVAVLRGKVVPIVRLIGDVVPQGATVTTNSTVTPSVAEGAVLAISKDKNGKVKGKKDECGEVECGTIEDRQVRLVDTSTHEVSIATTSTIRRSKCNKDEMGRSKSPILDDSNQKKRCLDLLPEVTGGDEKRRRPEYSGETSNSGTHFDETKQKTDERASSAHVPKFQFHQIQHQSSPSPPTPPRVFHALHAALQSGASMHVVDHVLQIHSKDVFRMDEHQRYPLHWAVGWAKTNEHADLVLKSIFKVFPQAALQRTWVENQLPLHIALSCKASERLVKALIEAHPTSAVEPCHTHDEWQKQKPLHLACRHGSSVGVLYQLLRVDPGVLPASEACSYAASHSPRSQSQ